MFVEDTGVLMKRWAYSTPGTLGLRLSPLWVVLLAWALGALVSDKRALHAASAAEFAPAGSILAGGDPLKLSLVPQLVVSGRPGTMQRIEFSERVGAGAKWIFLTNVVLHQPTNVVLDLTGNQGVRYYKAVVLPDPPNFVWIPPGSFLMGSPIIETDRRTDEILHPVTLTRGFWMNIYEVTIQEFLARMGTNWAQILEARAPPGTFGTNWPQGDDARLPVTRVKGSEVLEYCARLNAEAIQAGLLPGGYKYRLPTEAEGEYACRSGSTTTYFFGDDPGQLGDYAWFKDNADGHLHPVGLKKPNPWGLYDLLGNAQEMCSDWDWAYPEWEALDPLGPPSIPRGRPEAKVLRDGGYPYPASVLRSARRLVYYPLHWGGPSGFRVVLGPDLAPAEGGQP